MSDPKVEKVRKWKLLESHTVFSAEPWVRVIVDKVQLPGGRIVEDFYRVDLPEYAMVYAVNGEDRVLFEKQYKRVDDVIAYSLPTGCIESGEEPLATAQRELLEETGYNAAEWRSLGVFLVDGNKGCGRAHFFAASELKKVSEPLYDEMEETEVIFLPQQTVLRLLESGEISSLGSASLIALATHPNLSRLGSAK